MFLKTNWQRITLTNYLFQCRFNLPDDNCSPSCMNACCSWCRRNIKCFISVSSREFCLVNAFFSVSICLVILLKTRVSRAFLWTMSLRWFFSSGPPSWRSVSSDDVSMFFSFPIFFFSVNFWLIICEISLILFVTFYTDHHIHQIELLILMLSLQF